MTVTSQIARDQQFGDGVSTIFTVPFKVFAASWMQVLSTVGGVTTQLTLTTDYTVSNLFQQQCTVTFVVAPASGALLTFSRITPRTQETDYVPNDPFPAQSHENALDKLTMIVNDLGDVTDRAIVLPPESLGVSTTLPGPQALYLLRWNAAETALENALPPEIATLAPGAVVDATVSPIAGIQGTKLNFIQGGAGAVNRTMQAKAQERVSVKDNGAVGNNVTNDGPAIASAFSNYRYVTFPTADYRNTTTALVLPFDKTAIFDPSASIQNSGAGSYTQSGGEIRFGYNPSGQTGWTNNVPSAYEVISADLGGYGTRQHGPTGIPTAVGGAVNVPVGANAAPHANGIAGYAKTASTSCGAVAIFGHGKSLANNALSWGINTVSEDNGFLTTVWGAELDFNIQNVNTTVLGVQVVGGSTVEPALAIGFQVAPINAFTSPTKRWSHAFDSQDGAARTGLQLGAVFNQANSESQSIVMNFKNAANVRTQCFYLQSDTGGNMNMRGGAAGTIFTIAAGGAATPPISMLNNGLGLFGATPVGRQTSAANAVDLATAITLVNALKTGLINLGAFS